MAEATKTVSDTIGFADGVSQGINITARVTLAAASTSTPTASNWTPTSGSANTGWSTGEGSGG